MIGGLLLVLLGLAGAMQAPLWAVPLLALLIAGTFALGVYMHELPFSPARLKYYSWHKWAGVTILLLSLLRLAWRLTHKPPPDVAMPGWQASAAHATATSVPARDGAGSTRDLPAGAPTVRARCWN